jgi:hypothetical protein
MKLEQWIRGIISKEQPSEDIIAYYFGLFESLDHYMIYLSGSTEYDAEDPDWACNDDFTPEDKYLRLQEYRGLSWQEVLEKVRIELEAILKTEVLRSSFLGKAKAIAVGFDDGDLVTIHQKK